MVKFLYEIFPISTHVIKMKNVNAIKINDAIQTDVLLPISKTIVQTILSTFVIPKYKWVFKVQVFLIKL
jgi:hypothetical protein